MDNLMKNRSFIPVKAIGIESFGGADNLKLLNVETPEPTEKEVLIRVKYAGINPVDWKVREGMLKGIYPHEFPLILGLEASGIVTKVGKEVTRFKEGDEVFTYCRKPVMQWGTYAEFVAANEEDVALKPGSISFAQAAGVPLTALTAWQAFFDFGHLEKGQTVLIHAGAGGVGSFAIGIAKYIGAHVLTTCRQTNNEYVANLGADEIIDYTQTPFDTYIKEKHPDGLDFVLDAVGGETLKKSLPLLKKRATIVSIVNMYVDKMNPKPTVRAGYLFVAPNGGELSEISRWIDEGFIQVAETTEMPLEKAKEAHLKLQEGHTRGKIVLKL